VPAAVTQTHLLPPRGGTLGVVPHHKLHPLSSSPKTSTMSSSANTPMSSIVVRMHNPDRHNRCLTCNLHQRLTHSPLCQGAKKRRTHGATDNMVEPAGYTTCNKYPLRSSVETPMFPVLPQPKTTYERQRTKHKMAALLQTFCAADHTQYSHILRLAWLCKAE
jgi:hypothetical protein